MTKEELASIVRYSPPWPVAKLFGYLQTHDIESVTKREAEDLVVKWFVEKYGTTDDCTLPIRDNDEGVY
jgi:hypothetical protein